MQNSNVFPRNTESAIPLFYIYDYYDTLPFTLVLVLQITWMVAAGWLVYWHCWLLLSQVCNLYMGAAAVWKNTIKMQFHSQCNVPNCVSRTPNIQSLHCKSFFSSQDHNTHTPFSNVFCSVKV